MTLKPGNPAGQEYNTWWRAQQAKTPTGTPANVPPVATKPGDQTSPQQQAKPNPGPPAECRDCPVRTGCKAALKLWHKKTPRTGLWRAWNDLIEKNKALMVCLKGDSKP